MCSLIMYKNTIKDIERRYKQAKSWYYYWEKFMDFTLGHKEYSNDDVDELINYYEEKEQYKLCEKLIKLKK